MNILKYCLIEYCFFILKALWSWTWPDRLAWWSSSNGNIFRVTGPLWGDSPPDPDKFPSQRPVMRSSVDVSFDLHLNKQFSKKIVTPVIWDAIALIMTPLSWGDCKSSNTLAIYTKRTFGVSSNIDLELIVEIPYTSLFFILLLHATQYHCKPGLNLDLDRYTDNDVISSLV